MFVLQHPCSARERWYATYGPRFGMTNPAVGAGPGAAAAGYGTRDLNASAALNGNGAAAPGAGGTVYDSAVRISSPRLLDQGAEPSTVTKRVVRQVEVPFVRQVQVHP
jgi:hypothetical protein